MLLALIIFIGIPAEVYGAKKTTEDIFGTFMDPTAMTVEVGQVFTCKDFLWEYNINSPLYEICTIKPPKAVSSDSSVQKVYSNGNIKGLKTGKAKLTLKSGSKKAVVTVTVVGKKYSKKSYYKDMEKKIAALHKKIEKKGITASNCKTVITEVAKISQLTNRLAADIFKTEYKVAIDNELLEYYPYHPPYTIVDELEQPLYTDNYIDYDCIDAEQSLIKDRLLSGQINTLNGDISELKRFLDKWNPFDERNKTAFVEKKITQKGGNLKMTLKEPVSNKQLLGSLTLYGSSHSLAAWAYQLPQKNPTKQTIECEAWVMGLSGQKLNRYYTGSYKSGTKTIVWKRDLDLPSHRPNLDHSTDELPEGDYVLLYAPKLNEEFSEADYYYKKWKKAKTQADYDDIYEEFGSIGGMSHIGFYEFTVK